MDVASRPGYRLFLGEIARDELVKLTIPGLVRERRDPERLRLWVGGDSTAVYMGGSLAALVDFVLDGYPIHGPKEVPGLLPTRSTPGRVARTTASSKPLLATTVMP